MDYRNINTDDPSITKKCHPQRPYFICQSVTQCLIITLMIILIIFIVLLIVFVIQTKNNADAFFDDGDNQMHNIIPNELAYYHKFISTKGGHMDHLVNMGINITSSVKNSLQDYDTLTVVNKIISKIHTDIDQINVTKLMDEIASISESIAAINKYIHEFAY